MGHPKKKKKGVPARLQEKALAGAGSGDAVLVGDDAPKTTGIPPYPPRAPGSNSHTKIPSAPSVFTQTHPSQDPGGSRRAVIF